MNMETVQTVTGPAAFDQLGVILPHEHLFNDLTARIDDPAYGFSQSLTQATVSPENVWALRQDPYCCADNLRDKPVTDVVRELNAFAKIGGGTIVDATGSAGIGRNPWRLLEAAQKTGLNVIMSTAPYLEVFEAAGADLSADEIAQRIDDDLNIGVDDTGIKAGLIGEVGVSPEFTDQERRALRGAALAQTNNPHAALNIHMPGWQRRGDQVLKIVIDEAGVDPAKVSLAHSDPSGHDVDYQRRLLNRGVWLEFDMIGLDVTFPHEGVSPTVNQTAHAVAGLIEAGFDGQLLLSHDLFLKQMWSVNGGNGFSFVPTVFLELLAAAGVNDAIVKKLVTENPARMLTGH
ncbi:phosphotriesterase family protein [Spelaeicoccus albus]|uniref:Phosphotriesterase-related protein n=1 Tax=Spelaeicoccus albus TaxID=1280376 RepID=A0A7Z0D4L6_9MICO|nr:hypothetical protein [Spelaeicoccus albus]NYI68802.1 phosphotriesterase-related protein [Spelaeicoccus albus]